MRAVGYIAKHFAKWYGWVTADTGIPYATQHEDRREVVDRVKSQLTALDGDPTIRHAWPTEVPQEVLDRQEI